MSLALDKSLREFHAEQIITMISSNPSFYILFSPVFYDMKKEEQEKLYNEFEELQAYDISLEDVKRASEDLDNLMVSSVAMKMLRVVKWIIDNQDEDGYWKILKKDNLMDIDEELYGKLKLENSTEGYVEKEKTGLIPNAWTNAMLTLILMKWLSIAEDLGIESEEQLKKITITIENSKRWLKENKNQVDNIKGWGPFIPSIAEDVINTYDTSFVYITLIFDAKTEEDVKNLPEHHEVIQSLLSSNLRDEESGAWSIHNKSKNIDIGATSYALMSLMKNNEKEGNKDFAQDVIEKGIDWLVQQQNRDSGWGEKTNMNSRTDRTCYSLLALLKYKDMYGNKYRDPIFRGITFLRSKIKRFLEDENVYCWSSDDSTQKGHPCFKTSSLVVSTLLKCGYPIYDHEVRRGISGLIRLYNAYLNMQVESQKRSPIDSLDKAYFLCMLADYLKAWMKS